MLSLVQQRPNDIVAHEERQPGLLRGTQPETSVQTAVVCLTLGISDWFGVQN